MRMLTCVVSAVALALGSLVAGQASAAGVGYSAPGVENASSYSFIASLTGSVTAYFVSSQADYTQVIGLLVNGVPTGITGLNNHTSSLGDSLVLGYAQAGDTLTFVDYILSGPKTPYALYSAPGLNAADGWTQHVYSVAVTAGEIAPSLPAGVLVGFEDLPGGRADYDYNDVQFIYTSVPEPSTWAMMALGFGGLGYAAFRRSRRGERVAVA